MTTLDKLYQIPGFGKRIILGSGQYAAKFRVKNSDSIKVFLSELRRKYPDLLYHESKQKGSIIFGYYFSSQSVFWEDARWVMTIKKKLV